MKLNFTRRISLVDQLDANDEPCWSDLAEMCAGPLVSHSKITSQRRDVEGSVTRFRGLEDVRELARC